MKVKLWVRDSETYWYRWKPTTCSLWGNNLSWGCYGTNAAAHKKQNIQSHQQDSARLVIVAHGFWWGALERAFFDIRCFKFCPLESPFFISLHLSTPRKPEEKTLWATNLQGGAFIIHSSCLLPLGPAATAFYKWVASQLSDKWKQPTARQ